MVWLSFLAGCFLFSFQFWSAFQPWSAIPAVELIFLLLISDITAKPSYGRTPYLTPIAIRGITHWTLCLHPVINFRGKEHPLPPLSNTRVLNNFDSYSRLTTAQEIS